MSRRATLLWIGFVCVTLFFFTGCQKQDSAPAGQKPSAPAAPEIQSQTLTIFSWWTAGGEAEGLAELINLFKQQEPTTTVVNAAVAGGAGANAKAVLKTRMLGGDAPGTFQVHGGAELLETWVKPGMMRPITNLYRENNWNDLFPKQLIDMVSRDNEIYAVPSNVHRGNVLWYNKATFAENKIEPPQSFDDLLKAAKTLQAKGIIPIALASRNKWPVLHLFETLLLAAGGPEFYNDLFAGKIEWTDERVKKALFMLAQLIELANKDHSALTWDQACGLVKEGKAAMTVMGDWANGYFKTQGFLPDQDYGAIPVPGTQGYFVVITDTFGLPAKAPDPKSSAAFLKIVGSQEGQLAFNLKKGSIPARTDVTMDGFDSISRKTADDFKKDTLVPSCAHGSAAIEQLSTSLSDQLSVFAAEKNVEETAKAFEFAAKDSGIR